jgi:D-glycero-D-manno-heptose 1,7-bisphosphate phosphatase
MQPLNSSRVIILDRDGIINQDSKDYIKSVDEFNFLPGSVDAIAKLTKAGFRIGLATNQSGISRGYYDEAELHKIHKKMLDSIHISGGKIDEIAFCPHLPEALCDCRKPKPGMLLDLANRFACNARDIIFIGDKLTDILAALSIGAEPMLVYSSMTDENILDKYANLQAFSSLAECADHIMNNL